MIMVTYLNKGEMSSVSSSEIVEDAIKLLTPCLIFPTLGQLFLKLVSSLVEEA